MSHVSGRQAPDSRHRRDGAFVSAWRWLRVQAADVDAQTQSRRAARLRGKRLRVEVMLAGAGTPTPPPVTALVEADLLDEVPPDVDELLRLLPQADVYLQDEVPFAFHPTLTRVWGRQGRRGQRLVEAPGANDKLYGFGLVDWCAGWCDGRLAPGRTADVFCAQVRAAVARSRTRGRLALVIVDNLRTHTPAGSKLVRQMLAELHDHLRLIYTPAYDPDANRIEWLWRWSRREVTHNHQRETFAALVEDIEAHFQTLAHYPHLVLRQLGSPFADQVSEDQSLAYAA
jgi:transposase